MLVGGFVVFVVFVVVVVFVAFVVFVVVGAVEVVEFTLFIPFVWSDAPVFDADPQPATNPVLTKPVMIQRTNFFLTNGTSLLILFYPSPQTRKKDVVNSYLVTALFACFIFLNVLIVK